MPGTFEQLMERLTSVDEISPKKTRRAIALTKLVGFLLNKNNATLADAMKLLLRYLRNKKSLNDDLLAQLENNNLATRMIESLYSRYPEKYDHFLVPLGIYISEDNPEKFETIRKAAFKVAEINKIYLGFPGPKIKGSILQWFKGAFDIFSEKTRLSDRIEKIETALEVQNIDRPRAQIDRELAGAVAELITALSSVDEGVLALGSLVLIKLSNENKGKVISFNMTKTQLEMLNKNPDLLKNPEALLKLLRMQQREAPSLVEMRQE